VGSRVVARAYGVTPKSHLLRNDGRGQFTDVTEQVAPALLTAGMVTSAAWIDPDGNGKRDLVVVGEWTPVRLFRQQGGRFVDRTMEAGLGDSEGWWNHVSAADVNGDGRVDLVLGNQGLNSYISASRTQPAEMYVFDFFDNGTLEQIITFYKRGVSYPLATRDEMVKQMPALRAKFTTYKSFGASRVQDILPAEELAKASVLTVRTFASAVAISDANGNFTLRPLPVEAQFAPVYATLVRDFDGDGKVDLLLGGNRMGAPPMLGQSNASFGLLLHGNGDGTFAAFDMLQSGVDVRGEIRQMHAVRRADGRTTIVIARNDDRLAFLRVRQ